jgi:hypothetical protein
MQYHMRRSDREITDKNKIRGIIRAGKYAAVALCSRDEPYVVALSYGFDEGADAFYFHGAAQGRKIDLIRANPQACLTIIEDLGYQQGECTHAYRSVVVRGKMVLVDDPRERVHGITVMIRQLEAHPEKQLLKITEADAVWHRTQIFKLAVESMTAKERPPIV